MGEWMRPLTVFLLIVLVFGGCSLQKDTAQMTAEEHFAYARELFDEEALIEAEEEFRVITMRHSGTPITDDAQFYLAETYFAKEEFLVASSEYGRLVRDMPQSVFVEEASYKTAVCYYELSPRMELAQKYTDLAIREFELFITDFPNSDFIPDARAKVKELRTKLAERMLKAAYIYRRLDEHRSAIKYIDLLLERYYDTDIVPEALYEKGLVYLEQENFTMVKDILIKLRSIDANDLYEQLLEDYAPAYEEFFGEVAAELQSG
jgi:outer membrane protein assembly factor BamD